MAENTLTTENSVLKAAALEDPTVSFEGPFEGSFQGHIGDIGPVKLLTLEAVPWSLLVLGWGFLGPSSGPYCSRP